MEIVNIELIGKVLAIAVVVQYFVDKLKYSFTIEDDKKYSVLVAGIAFMFSAVLVLAFNVELFNSDFAFINYLLSAGVAASGAGGVNSFLNLLKNKDEKEVA